MPGTKLAMLAGTVLLTGVCGCSLPEVLPLQGGSSSGPSPYGIWYEQHWATNAVLLAAADQPEGESPVEDEAAADEVPADLEADLAGEQPQAAVEASAATVSEDAEFDASTPYQFPSSSFVPGAEGEKPATPSSGGGSIRY